MAYIATPFPNVSSNQEHRSKKNYNFHHSQLHIRIECTIEMLVQRWGILQAALLCNMSIQKIIATVNASEKLHNFYVNDSNVPKDIPESLDNDTNYIMNHRQGYVYLVWDN